MRGATPPSAFYRPHFTGRPWMALLQLGQAPGFLGDMRQNMGSSIALKTVGYSAYSWLPSTLRCQMGSPQEPLLRSENPHLGIQSSALLNTGLGRLWGVSSRREELWSPWTGGGPGSRLPRTVYFHPHKDTPGKLVPISAMWLMHLHIHVHIHSYTHANAHPTNYSHTTSHIHSPMHALTQSLTHSLPIPMPAPTHTHSCRPMHT